MSSVFILLSLILVVSVHLVLGHSFVVNTELGKIKGTHFHTTPQTRSYYGFMGIPYAKPPVDELRFQPPQPVDAWNENVFDATQDGPGCIQLVDDWDTVSEDCLRLNVYTEKLPSGNTATKRPVIFFIHPGGFYVLYGRKDYFGPDYFMNEDVVLVTINYRLGSLGFMSTGTANATGNMGLKDQVMALKWVKQHISKFGGDPDNVTLMGYSVGGGSSTMHLLSPMSRGLFNKVIAMSGSVTSGWKLPGSEIELARRQAGLLNISSTLEPEELIKELKKVEARKFGETLPAMFDLQNWNPLSLWSAIVEPDFGQERFLTEDPIAMYKRGDFMKVPILTGVTRDELLNVAYYLIKNDTSRNQIETNFTGVAPIYFLYERNTERSKAISNKLKTTFIDGATDPIEAFNIPLSDSCVGFGVHNFVKFTAKYTPVYYYKFVYEGRYGYFMLDGKSQGVVHHDDLLYLFHIPPVSPIITATDPESPISKRHLRMWMRFVETGNPNIPEVQWDPVQGDRFNYLEIGNETVMKDGLYTERYQVWSEIFPEI